ncbi:MAG: protein kinase domain-containing protein [Gemmatimonadaceae bacterium]
MRSPVVSAVLDRLQVALAERYRLECEIGQGGMAVVYRAYDLKHDRTVAIKVLLPEIAVAVGSDRFLREIRIEARLQHPHILPLHDSGEADGFLYYVMPYVTGESLRHRLEREKQLPLADAIGIARDVASALDYAHAQGIIHRDIKPANILLSGGQAIVADFGIARAMSSVGGEQLTMSGVAVGTPQYMSPEQGSGEARTGGSSDIYALGCVVYEMLAGEPPFTGRTTQAIVARHLREPPPPLRVLRPTVPVTVQIAVERALAKVPADRYATAAEFVGALASPDVAPLPGDGAAPPATARGTRRRVLIAAALLAVAGTGVWRMVTARDPPTDAGKVMVFPLVDHGASDGGAGSGEEVAIMIGSALEHTEPLRWIDGWTWLDERVRGNVRRLATRSARALSLQQRARHFVTGSIARAGDSAMVVLRLHDAVGDSLVSQASVSGANTASLTQLGLRAVGELLPVLVQPGRQVDRGALSLLRTRHPAAVANWLQGEREYRRSHFSAALDFLHRAVEIDSGLTLAALRGAEAANWLERHDDADRLLAVALAQDSLLPPRYRHFTHGLRDYFVGAADSAVANFHRALALDSTWSAAHMALGEVYYHLLPRAGPLDSLAEAAFAAARRRDPDFAPALFHLAELALRRGNVRHGESLVREFDALRPDSARALELSLVLRCVRDGVGEVDWSAAARRSPSAVAQAARTLAATAVQPECAARGFRAVLDVDSAPLDARWGSVIGLQSVLAAQGKRDSVVAVLDAAAASGLPAAMGLYVVDAVAGLETNARADSVIATLGGPYEAMGSTRLWYNGIWQAHRRDVGRLTAIVNAMEALDGRPGVRGVRTLAAALSARLAVLLADSTRALAYLRTISPHATPREISWGFWEPLAGERLLLSELLMARHEYEEALRVADGFDHPQPIVYLLYLPASLRLRIDAAEKLGRSEAAARYRNRLQALRLGDVPPRRS